MGLRSYKTFAGQARGAMCKYIVQKRVKDPAGLKKFTGDRTRASPRLSLVTIGVACRRCAEQAGAHLPDGC